MKKQIHSFKIFFCLFSFLFSLMLLLFYTPSLAVDLTSTNFIIHDPIIGTLGGYGTSTNFQLRYGFLYYQDEGRITFDIDTEAGGGNGESSTPYTVGLGAVTTTDTRVSGTTDGIQMIVLEGETGAAVSGMVVTVRNANGANGMVSTSVPTDNIGSADGTMADGTENYGLCVVTNVESPIGFFRASPYESGTCAADTETNDIQGLTTAGENILNSAGAPLSDGYAEVIVNAAVSATTPAHSDYTDTLTFIATGTF